jgi:hypothetical protein
VSVYVDNMFMPAKVGRSRPAKWCHLTADSHEELVEFAEKIGLRPEWIQYEGTWKEHFDVTMTKRAEAVRQGAVEVDMYEHVQRMAEKRMQ